MRNPKENPLDTNQNVRGTSNFTVYSNLEIRNIDIVRLDPFGPTIYQPYKKPGNFSQKTGNWLHFKTSFNLLEKYLLFAPGEMIDPLTMADTERLLRDLGFIEDADIMVTQIAGSNLADVEITVKDRWAYGLGGEISEVNKGKLDLINQNIFGLGHENNNTFIVNGDYYPNLGYDGTYVIKNVGGKFFDAMLRYRDEFGTYTYEADFSRQFFTSSTKYAGGIGFERTVTRKTFRLQDTVIANEPLDYQYHNFWIGRAIPIKGRNLLARQRQNIVLTTRYYQKTYFERPPGVTAEQLYAYYIGTFYWAALGILSSCLEKAT
ncbi:MAG: hypothetical protein HC896_07810 [Bacteroidales bacterium]|nr:hypothetical protein [Bacteroidales bacterium]